MGKRAILCLWLLAFWTLLGSGCTLQNLKESNRRLKESNNRLIAENNRLEHELSIVERERFSAREIEVADSTPVARAADPGRETLSVAEDLLLEPNVEVSRTAEGVRIRVPDRVFFAPGQVKLSAHGKEILSKVARLINSQYTGQLVRVDGHTDDTPIRKVRNLFPTNWELSTAPSLHRGPIPRRAAECQRESHLSCGLQLLSARRKWPLDQRAKPEQKSGDHDPERETCSVQLVTGPGSRKDARLFSLSLRGCCVLEVGPPVGFSFPAPPFVSPPSNFRSAFLTGTANFRQFRRRMLLFSGQSGSSRCSENCLRVVEDRSRQKP